MRTLPLAVAILASIASGPTLAACTAKDFNIEAFAVKLQQGSGQPRFSMKGQLVNHCAEAAAAQVRIDAKDASGKVMASKQGWPAGTSNIEPGKAVDFDLGRLFRYQPGMTDYTVLISDAKTW
ncbi:hypothetical protein [Luteibacter aegosomatissinici]|uniref:hypothetical protein n=1 Tax=Luteibacter aegosomatissinici TaxID=2911539 RepID=UPI001FF9B577|nr:hypothetical protein [Luteibacter aegosomatissinici]UPG92811.1 hypothetical protein L2Y97_13145 [Luteibacter aegosomatissinici]